jgi:hypothetical protein
MRNRNDYRVELLNKKVRNWRIVAGLLVLIAFYGFMSRMDREANIERMHLENPVNSKALSGGVRV